MFGRVLNAMGSMDTTLQVVVMNWFNTDRILFSENRFVVGIIRSLMHRWKALGLLFSMNIRSSLNEL